MNSGLSDQTAPWKSSLSEYRSKVGFAFFRDIWREDLQKLQPARRKFRGFYVYSIDGDDLDLPVSRDILSQGYQGYPLPGNMQTYYPKMYTVQVVDVLNGVVVDFAESSVKQEVILARGMAKKLEQKSIAIYDRLHSSYQTVKTHEEVGSYYLIRLKDKNPKNQLEIQKFIRSKRKSKWIHLQAGRHDQSKNKNLPVLKVRLIRMKHAKEEAVFMTNLSEAQFSDEEISVLYQRRWEVETNFRDLTSSALRMNQWHTAKLNGIKQEIYALLWLVNQVRIQVMKIFNAKNLMSRIYHRANFKFCVQLVLDHLDSLANGDWQQVQRLLDQWIDRTTEKRKHLSRSYPRQVRYKRRRFKNASYIKRRPLTERH